MVKKSNTADVNIIVFVSKPKISASTKPIQVEETKPIRAP